MVESGLETAQLISRDHIAIGLRGVDGDVEFVEIGDRFDRHDMFAPNTVNQKVLSDAKDERLGWMRNLLASCLMRADIDVLAEIFDLALIGPLATKVMHQKWFQRQDFPDEPRIDIVHARSLRAMRACVFWPADSASHAAAMPTH